MNLKSRLRKAKTLSLFSLIAIVFASATPSQATHLMGSDIFYQCLGNGKYKITVKAYRDCNGINPSKSTIVAKCSSQTINISTGAQTQVSVRDITGIDPECSIQSRCSGSGSFPYGIQEYVWEAVLDLSSSSCCQWTVSWSQSARNSNITTGMANQNFYTETILNKCLSSCNSSPIFTTPPVGIFCHNQDIVFNNGALDTIDNGDSLSYELVPAKQNATVNCNYSSGFSYQRPLTFWGFPNQNLPYPLGFHLDPSTGDMTFRPTSNGQVAVIVLAVKEYRKDNTGTWVQIGESRRDMQVLVYNCSGSSGGGGGNTVPVLFPTTTPIICSGDSTCMTVTVADANAADTVKLSWNNGIPGAGFNIINPGTTRDTAMICWRPSDSDTSSVPYSFIVYAKDNACPFGGSSSRSYSMRVTLMPRTVMDFTVDTCGMIKMTSTPQSTYIDPVYSWALMDASNDTVFKSNQQNTFAFLDPGKYFVYHQIWTTFGCYSDFRDSFEVHPYPVVRSSLPNDTSICAFSPLSLNSTVTGGVAPLKYSWNTHTSDTFPSLNISPTVDTTVIITVSDKNLCYHQDTIVVNVNPIPTPEFAVNDSDQCKSGNNFIFTNASSITSGTLNYIWHFGDSDSDLATSPTKTFTYHDTFSVQLIAISDSLCKDSLTKSVVVYPQMQPNISFSDTSLCLSSNSFNFSATASTIPYGNIISYSWDFDDGNTASGANVYSKSFGPEGSYLVQLNTVSAVGCEDSVTLPVTIHPQMTAIIQANDTSQCLSGNEVIFNASSSSIPYGSIDKYFWEYGDGDTAVVEIPASKTYNTYDTFTVKLKITSLKGCTDSAYKEVVIHPQAIADFSRSDTSLCLKANNFVFDASPSSIPYGNISLYSWDFDNGLNSTGISQNHVFTHFDTFTIKLKTTTVNRCTDSISKDIIVHPQAVLSFTSNTPEQCLTDNQFLFDATASTINWGNIAAYAWDYGDGTADISVQPFGKTFNYHDTFDVSLYTESYFNCKDTLVQKVVVHPQMIPVIDVSDSALCLSNNSFVFSGASSSIPYGSIIAYDWYLSDGGNFTGANPSAKTFAYHDTFDVQLITTSINNCKDTANTLVAVHPQSIPVIFVSHDNECLSGNSFPFHAINSNIPYGFIRDYEWTYADGTIDIGAIPTAKSYHTEGSYTVRLKTITGNNCVDSAFQQITVHPQMKASINITDSFVCLSQNFFDISAASSTIPYGSINQYYWRFGDSTDQFGQILNLKTFGYYDTFDIRLRITSDKGCTDSMQHHVVVYPQAVVDFVINDSIQCFDAHQDYDFDATPSYVPFPWGSIDKYDWFVSDGDNRSGIIYNNKSFGSRNIFDVKLLVTTVDGCKDSLTKEVWHYPAAHVQFGINDTAQCFNEHDFIFNAGASNISMGSLVQYDWKYEDATSAQGLVSPSKYFAMSDTFDVRLVVTSNEGCLDSTEREVIVFASPLADFAVPETCMKQSSNFTDLSLLQYGNIIDWQWDFGDGRKSSDQHPVHYYSKPDKYTVQLQVTSNNNCVHDTAMNEVALVKTLPRAKFDHSVKDYDFKSTLLQYRDLSYDAQNWAWDFGDTKLSALQHPENFYADSGTYQVQLIAGNAIGCFDTSIQIIFVAPDYLFHIPNSFSPNDDNLNETFGAEGSVHVKRYHLKILNRWGQVMFESREHNAKWDGKYQGKECPEGVYVYVYHITDIHGENHAYKGSFYLLR